MGKANTRTLYGLIGVALAAVLLIAVNVVSDETLSSTRVDLTEGDLYSLSDGTERVLEDLQEPIKLEFFYSSRLGEEVPTYGTFADRVRELLDRYVELSDGMIQLQVYEPEPFSEVEDRAVGLGLQGVPIDQSGSQVYFGLVGTNSVDDENVIAFFQPERERFLEYDLTNFIFELANPEKPVVGLISSLPLAGDARPPMNTGTRPWVVWDQMNQFFEVREQLSNTQEIDPEIDILMVVHPKNISDEAMYAIDQYMMRGGKAIFMVDPHAEADRIRPNPDAVQRPRTKSDMDKLFDAWGFDVDTDHFVGDLRGAFRVQAGPSERLNAVDYVAWVGIGEDRLNDDDVVTGDLQRINVAAAGAITAKPDAGITVTPLIRSSSDAMLIDADKIRVTEPNPTRLLSDFQATGEEYVIAARIQGALKSAFPDGPPKPQVAEVPEGTEKSDTQKEAEAQDQAAYEERAAAHRDATEGEATMIVVGDVDVLEDRFWVRVQDFFGERVAMPVADNGSFIVNSLENLAGSADLISLRSRREGDRPFEVVQRMRQDAELRFRATERELQQRLEDAEAKLAELRREGVGGQGGAIMTQDQQAEIEKFRADVIQIRRQLRDVQHALREEIESLGTLIKFLNIALVPLLVLVIAAVTAVLRARRRRPVVQG